MTAALPSIVTTGLAINVLLVVKLSVTTSPTIANAVFALFEAILTGEAVGNVPL